jgi:hypothetical protein
MLLVQTGVTGTLLSLDVVLFYFFWEIMLLPVFLMIGQFEIVGRPLATPHIRAFARLHVQVRKAAPFPLLPSALVPVGSSGNGAAFLTWI